jgi:NAD(P)-dependent dehydrogenase (short-subunit alcohol dehydrogenase family)
VLRDKVIVITGGAGLIGKQFVKVVVENEGIAIIADIDKLQIEIVKEKLTNDLNNTDCIDSVELDITSKKSIKKAISYLNQKYGRIDALINNAYPRNKNYGRNFFDVDYSDFVENLGMHLGGYFLTSQIFSQYFKKQNYGNIINLSSIYGVIAPKFEIYNGTTMTTSVEYVVIKSGLIHLTKYMAKYFSGMNIRVNAISPGGVFDHQPQEFLKNYNEQCLSKGMLENSDINGTVLYLLSDMSQYLNGQNIIVDDGFCL